MVDDHNRCEWVSMFILVLSQVVPDIGPQNGCCRCYLIYCKYVLVGNSVQPLLMVMPSINPLGTVLGTGTL